MKLVNEVLRHRTTAMHAWRSACVVGVHHTVRIVADIVLCGPGQRKALAAIPHEKGVVVQSKVSDGGKS